MTRIETTFARLASRGECGLFPYLTAGYPDPAASLELAEAALAAGVDGFEIGVPFSDPLADGATLQRANATALQSGATLDTALDLASAIRKRAPELPIALMSYCNPVMHRGEAELASALAQVGADAAIIPDLPVEESDSLGARLSEKGLDLVQMLAPTSSADRMARVGAKARGFVYCVALVGVTGARQSLSESLPGFLSRARSATPLPLVVGFGISRPEHVQRVTEYGAQGVIVASALVDLAESAGGDTPGAVKRYLQEMKAATRPAAAASA